MNVVLALIGVCGVSASGPLMAGANAPALAISFWRNAMAAGLLVPVAATVRRRELRALTYRDVRAIVFAGSMLACHFATWVTSLKMTSVASATALVCLQVGWIVFFEHLRGTPADRGVVIGLALAFGGVVVVSGVDLSLSSRALAGDLLALCGGAFAALYTMTGASVRRRVTTTTYTATCYAACAAVLLVFALATGQDLVGFDARTWAAIVGVMVASQLFGHSLFNHLLAVMSPTLVSLIILLEVPGAALLAGVFLGQTPGVGVYVGLGLIIAGLAVVVTRRPPSEDEAPVGPAD
ncbi:DMT family transporter [Solicola gregarius]|uniref:DMT family transporter n=1 Tax=Solicola gregarius TaxID=2908642 RepID=A0AA46TIV2_9ACTN|nr:DMT family transporter [Solicola gregarius]UYM06159.1 DMT family transporter [Solicola gregarius]